MELFPKNIVNFNHIILISGSYKIDKYYICSKTYIT